MIIQKIAEDGLEDYILTRHPRFRRALRKSLKEKEAGKVKPLEGLAKELGVELWHRVHGRVARNGAGESGLTMG